MDFLFPFSLLLCGHTAKKWEREKKGKVITQNHFKRKVGKMSASLTVPFFFFV